MTEIFDNDGILIGWMCQTSWKSPLNGREVFIPRRDEDVDSDRATIGRLMARVR